MRALYVRRNMGLALAYLSWSTILH